MKKGSGPTEERVPSHNGTKLEKIHSACWPKTKSLQKGESESLVRPIEVFDVGDRRWPGLLDHGKNASCSKVWSGISEQRMHSL